MNLSRYPQSLEYTQLFYAAFLTVLLSSISTVHAQSSASEGTSFDCPIEFRDAYDKWYEVNRTRLAFGVDESTACAIVGSDSLNAFADIGRFGNGITNRVRVYFVEEEETDLDRAVSPAVAEACAVHMDCQNYQAPADSGCNLLANGGFEQGSEGWYSNSGITTIPEGLRGQGLQLSNISSIVSAKENTRYDLTAYALAKSQNSWTGLGIDFLDSAGVEISEIFRRIPVGLQGSESVPEPRYYRLSLAEISPPGTRAIQVWAIAPESAEVFVDDIDLRPNGCDIDGSINQEPLIKTPGDQNSTNGEEISVQLDGADAEGSVLQYAATGLPTGLTIDQASGLISGTAATQAPSRVTVTISDGELESSVSFNWRIEPNGVVPANCNLFKNGDFEDRFFQTWNTRVRGAPTSPAIDWNAYRDNPGEKSVRLYGSISQSVVVQPGSNFIFTGSYRLTEQFRTNVWLGFGIDYLNAAGVEIGEETITPESSDGWRFFSLSGVIPADAVRVQFWAVNRGTTRFWMDDLRLMDGSCGI